MAIIQIQEPKKLVFLVKVNCFWGFFEFEVSHRSLSALHSKFSVCLERWFLSCLFCSCVSAALLFNISPLYELAPFHFHVVRSLCSGFTRPWLNSFYSSKTPQLLHHVVHSNTCALSEWNIADWWNYMWNDAYILWAIWTVFAPLVGFSPRKIYRQSGWAGPGWDLWYMYTGGCYTERAWGEDCVECYNILYT